jgi:hypothetical protein
MSTEVLILLFLRVEMVPHLMTRRGIHSLHRNVNSEPRSTKQRVRNSFYLSISRVNTKKKCKVNNRLLTLGVSQYFVTCFRLTLSAVKLQAPLCTAVRSFQFQSLVTDKEANAVLRVQDSSVATLVLHPASSILRKFVGFLIFRGPHVSLSRSLKFSEFRLNMIL